MMAHFNNFDFYFLLFLSDVKKSQNRQNLEKKMYLKFDFTFLKY